MSPVNSDPSNQASSGGGMPLTRKELRARERFLATQNQDIVEVPDFVPEEVTVPAPVAAAAVLPAPISAARRFSAPEAPEAPAAAPQAASVPAAVPETVPEPVQHVDVRQGDAGRQGDAAVAELHGDAEPRHDVHGYADVHLDGHADVHYDDHAYLEHHEHDEHGYDEHGYVEHDEHAAHEYDSHHGYEAYEGHGHEVLDSPAAAKAPSKKVRHRRRVVALLITLGVFVAAISIGAQFLRPILGMDRLSDYPGPGTGSVTVTVPAGSGPKAIAGELEEKHVVANADTFLKAFIAAGGELSPGDFQFRTEMTNADAVAVLQNQDASKVIYFALSAGLRINESLEAISKGSGIPVQQLKALSDAPAQFGAPAKAKNLEGFLAPGEYRFPLGTAGKDIMQKLVSTTLDELKAQGITDPAKQFDTVIIASIVQAEGGQADYGNVAGAIYNRLKPGNSETNGLIQSDAAVTYGLGTKSFNFTEEQRLDKANPYNTYAIAGLPVGPIGSPGKSAIDAAAKPTANEYLYWVTINLDTKETKFSKTLAEHNVYVAQYNAWCAANAGRCV
ncbi:endolytic transglycosylase MltG [Arthrobacter cavernae]|uniref:Endolytic murein transglycosylase n=1 Tax=Arthrobacter cavernae TaxID=2817681 RepID=A0A939HHA7_9MICC|nr:endolytic transglycosylase MltG [Arthrobacter cavernae]MBO1268450.1 endolytic transglycosylase MltG [Arthrobacter cavernae]